MTDGFKMKFAIPLLVFVVFCVCAGQALSPLKSVHNDLSRLNRIINAISLQTFAIDRTVKTRQIGAELLGTSKEHFTTLLETNVAGIKTVIEKMFDPANAIPASTIDGLDEKKMALVFITDSVAKLANLTAAKTASTDGVMAMLKAQQGTSKSWEFCSRTEDIVESGSVLDGTSKLSSDNKKKFVKNVVQNGDDIYQCFEKISQFVLDRENNIITYFHPVDQLYGITETLETYQQKFVTLNNVSSVFGTLKSDFTKSSNFRQVIASNSSLELSKIFEAHFASFQHRSKAPEYTAGFPKGYEDIPKIFDDLNSDWFLKNVAYGNKTNVKILEDELKMFRKFTGEMETLRRSYTDLLGMNLTAPGMFAADLEGLEKYKVASGIEQSLDTSATNFGTCINKGLTQEPAFDFKDFQEVNQKLTSVLNALKLLIDNLKTTSTEVNGEKLKEFFTALQKVNTTKTLDLIILDIKKLSNFETFTSFADFFKQEQKLQTDLTEEIKKVDTNKKIPSVAQVLTDSKLLDVLGCFENHKFDGQKMQDAINFLAVAREFTSNSASKNAIIQYLDALATVQQNGHAVERMVVSVKQQVGLATSSVNSRTRRAQPPKSPVLNLKNHVAVTQTLATALNMLKDMDVALANKDKLENVKNLPANVAEEIVRMATVTSSKKATEDAVVATVFKNPNKTFGEMLDGLKQLSAFAENYTGNLTTIVEVFERASKIHGFELKKEVLEAIETELEAKNLNNEATVINELSLLNLNFVSGPLHSASTTLTSLKTFFDGLFGKLPTVSRIHTRIVTEAPPLISTGLAVGLVCAFFILLILGAFVCYGFTKNGREKYYNTWLYYFPNEEVFERRWRYSFFLDRENGKNALLDASREVNPENVHIHLYKGAYVNAYSLFGNTSLHMATKLGYHKVVELLIKNGADMTLLNARNKTAEETIPKDYKETRPKDAWKFAAIEAMYNKYRNKKFRIRVPRLFKTHMFHIYPHPNTDDKITMDFTDLFQGIVSNERLINSSHFIFKTNADGVMETDDIDDLYWIISGCIIVKESWMVACIADQKAIRRDYEHLIEHISFKGTLLKDCVIPWTRAQAKGEFPYLCGAHVVFVVKDCPKIHIWQAIIVFLGGVFLQAFPDQDHYIDGSHPNLHSHMGPIFMIHDGSLDLTYYKSEPLFSPMTEDEFAIFLLRRDIRRVDTRPCTKTWLGDED